MLYGDQFDLAEVLPQRDASLYSFLNFDKNHIIKGRGREFQVLTEGAEGGLSLPRVTVDTGEAIIYGRHITNTSIINLTIDSNFEGYVVIEIDLSKINEKNYQEGETWNIVNNQLQVKLVTNLKQENLLNNGLIYDFNLGKIKYNGQGAPIFTKEESPKNMISNMLDIFYPVGSIIENSNADFNPNSALGGTWVQIEGRMLIGANSTYPLGSANGSASHVHTTGSVALTTANLPAHSHSIAERTIDGGRHRHQWACSSGEGNETLHTATKDRKVGYRWTEYGDSHSHTIPAHNTNNTGSGTAHNHGNTGSASNLPPYKAVNIWERTA